jgi:hypothetical protein
MQKKVRIGRIPSYLPAPVGKGFLAEEVAELHLDKFSDHQVLLDPEFLSSWASCQKYSD